MTKFTKLTAIIICLTICSNYACAADIFEQALYTGFLSAAKFLLYVLFGAVLAGLIIKAFGVFGYIFVAVALALSVFL